MYFNEKCPLVLPVKILLAGVKKLISEKEKNNRRMMNTIHVSTLSNILL